MRYERPIELMMILLVAMVLLTGCSKRNPNTHTKVTENTSASQTDEKTVTLTGVIADLETDSSTVVLTDIESEWNYTLSYDVYTELLSRYGEVIAASQLEIGEIVDVTFEEKTKVISKLQVSYEAWEYEKVTGLTYNQSENKIQVMGQDYTYTGALVMKDVTGAYKYKKQVKKDAEVSSTQEEQEKEDNTKQEDTLKPLQLSDISKYDTVTCRGYKGRIYSIVLESGHGYVRLSGYSSYIGGMIAIGDVVSQVTENMLLTVPVGEWTLEIDKDGKMGTKEIVVEQNVEQTVNLAELTIVACQKGIFHFVLSPANATITIDGKEYTGRTDFMLPYGVHKIAVSAVDYKSYNGTINLQVPYMNINVTLVAIDSEEASEVETNTSKKEAYSKTEATTEQATQEPVSEKEARTTKTDDTAEASEEKTTDAQATE